MWYKASSRSLWSCLFLLKEVTNKVLQIEIALEKIPGWRSRYVKACLPSTALTLGTVYWFADRETKPKILKSTFETMLAVTSFSWWIHFTFIDSDYFSLMQLRHGPPLEQTGPTFCLESSAAVLDFANEWKLSPHPGNSADVTPGRVAQFTQLFAHN